MSEVKVNGGNSQQTFSSNGISLKKLKDDNKLLFDFFQQKGYKEDAVIYSTDIDRIFKEADENGNSKISIKEGRALFGLKDSKRSEVRDAVNALKNIKTNQLSTETESLPVKISDNETDFYAPPR